MRAPLSHDHNCVHYSRLPPVFSRTDRMTTTTSRMLLGAAGAAAGKDARRRMRVVLALLVGLVTAALAVGAAPAQDFPTRPLQIVVPWPPGAIDIYVRLIKAPM